MKAVARVGLCRSHAKHGEHGVRTGSELTWGTQRTERAEGGQRSLPVLLMRSAVKASLDRVRARRALRVTHHKPTP